VGSQDMDGLGVCCARAYMKQCQSTENGTQHTHSMARHFAVCLPHPRWEVYSAGRCGRHQPSVVAAPLSVQSCMQSPGQIQNSKQNMAVICGSDLATLLQINQPSTLFWADHRALAMRLPKHTQRAQPAWWPTPLQHSLSLLLPTMQQITGLTCLTLSSNQLTGAIPSSWSTLSASLATGGLDLSMQQTWSASPRPQPDVP
jgi:hypothetical protein